MKLIDPDILGIAPWGIPSDETPLLKRGIVRKRQTHYY
jgi:hypothetical protein